METRSVSVNALRSGSRPVQSDPDALRTRANSTGVFRIPRDDSEQRFDTTSTYFQSNQPMFHGRDASGSTDGGKSATLLHPAPEEGSVSPLQAGVNMIKCAIGAGSFSLPMAFKNGGLWASFFATLLLGARDCEQPRHSHGPSHLIAWLRVAQALSAYTVTLLGRVERIVLANAAPADDPHRRSGGRARGEHDPAIPRRLTYPQLGSVVFPRLALRVRGMQLNLMAALISLGICLTSLGVCAAYVDFITSTVNTMGAKNLPVSPAVLLAVPVLALSFLRSFRFLAFTSVLGDVAVTAGVVSVVVYGLMHHGSLDWSLPAVQLRTFPRFLGSTAFLFAIHIVVLPIMQSMRDPTRFRAVTNLSYTFIACLNAVFAALCYMIFGDETRDNVMDNLPVGTFLNAVRVLLVVDLLFTTPMVLAASREIVEEAVLAALFGTREAHAGQGAAAVLPDAEPAEVAEGQDAEKLLRTRVRSGSDGDAGSGHGGAGRGDSEHVRLLREPPAARPHQQATVYPAAVFLTPRPTRRTAAASRRWTGAWWAVEMTRNAVRSGLVACMFAIAFGVPDFGDMVGLVGGFVNCLMGFILPPLLFLQVHAALGAWPSRVSVVAHVLIVLFGTAALVISTYFTVEHIVMRGNGDQQ